MRYGVKNENAEKGAFQGKYGWGSGLKNRGSGREVVKSEKKIGLAKEVVQFPTVPYCTGRKNVEKNRLKKFREKI